MDNAFLKNWLPALTLSVREDAYELYLRAIVTTYDFITKSAEMENVIRDRFYWDLRHRNPITKDLIDKGILDIQFERWERVTETENSRVDLSFFISGAFKFEIECKRLFEKWSDNKPYLEKGISRFINLKYGTENDYAAMVGFIITGNITDVFGTLIQKVNAFCECSPKRAGRNPINADWSHGFTSHHLRIDGRNIQIYHLLFPFKSSI